MTWYWRDSASLVGDTAKRSHWKRADGIHAICGAEVLANVRLHLDRLSMVTTRKRWSNMPELALTVLVIAVMGALIPNPSLHSTLQLRRATSSMPVSMRHRQVYKASLGCAGFTFWFVLCVNRLLAAHFVSLALSGFWKFARALPHVVFIDCRHERVKRFTCSSVRRSASTFVSLLRRSERDKRRVLTSDPRQDTHF